MTGCPQFRVEPYPFSPTFLSIYAIFHCVNRIASLSSLFKVWRVSWNVTGTILASSGDDGCVRLWKANYMDTWKSIGMLKGDAPVASGTLSGLSTSSQNASSTQNSLNIATNSGGSGAGAHFGGKPLYNTLPTGI